MTRTPFTTQTPIGALTNFGTFVGFDEKGFAHFVNDGRKGWVGSLAFNIVQVIS